jgi:hypothetical protein
MISVGSLVDTLTHRAMSLADDGIAVYWFQVPGDREIFRREVCDQRGDAFIVPLIVRSDGFDNPNAMLSDLIELVEGNRPAFQVPGARGPVTMLLLGKAPLRVAQLGSPAVLPEWFPAIGGRTVFVEIEDLTYTADASLSHETLQINRIAEELWALERALVDRIEAVHKSDHRQTNALLSYLRAIDSSVTIPSLIEASRAYRLRFYDPAGFRPSAREKQCFVSRLVLLVSSTSPSELSSRCAAIAQALGCVNIDTAPKETMPAVMLRPTQRDPNHGVRLARNIALTSFAAFQLMNANAHSGEYGRYPVLLLRGISHDLRMGLSSITTFLDAVTSGTGIE